MCGRFAFDPTERFAKRYGVKVDMAGLFPNYNVAPGQKTPVIFRTDKNIMQQMRWGLVPSWAKDDKIGYKMINARSENLKLKPSYKKPYLKQRCLIPVIGFYEWDKDKNPYYFTIDEKNSYFSLAGIYEFWQHDSELIAAFSIITKDSSADLKFIHARMPVVLNVNDEDKWLDSKAEIRDLDLIINKSQKNLTFWPVAKLVNNPKNNNKELTAKIITPKLTSR